MLVASGNIDPGRLDRRVTLLELTTMRDSAGAESQEASEIATVWAGKQPTRGGRLYAADEKHYESFVDYTIRHRADVRAGLRLVHGDDAFEVISVNELGRRHYLVLTCRGIDQSTGDNTGALDAGNGTAFLDAGDGVTVLDIGLAA